MSQTQRTTLFAIPILAALFFAGCAPKPKNGECKNSEDCTAQDGYGKICVEGRCQECSQDTDCKSGYVCRASKCVPKPECDKDADCAKGKTCQAGRCLTPVTAAMPDTGAGAGSCDHIEAVRFEFNEANLTPDSRAMLEKSAPCIKGKSATISGHADERGTTEYNLQLGEKRASAVKKYLVNLGIEDKKLKTVSYGEEKPANPGHDEGAWAENRRAEINVK